MGYDIFFTELAIMALFVWQVTQNETRQLGAQSDSVDQGQSGKHELWQHLETIRGRNVSSPMQFCL